LPFLASASIIAYMNQAFHLARLQKVDLQIDHLNTRLKEIDRLLKENSTVREAEKSVSDAESEVTKWHRLLKNAEDEVEAQRIKIETNESSLYGGKIHNPKELQDLQNDIASLKRHLSSLEDEQLNAMLALEDREAVLKKAAGNLNAVQAQFISQNADLAGERAKINENLQRLLGEREAVLKPLTEESIAIYRHLREQKRGIAVALAEDGACTACGSELRPEEMQSARSPNTIVYCASCGRILYSG
jgi:predicted  nucleic acid-binding Zn-ribbon protein